MLNGVLYPCRFCLFSIISCHNNMIHCAVILAYKFGERVLICIFAYKKIGGFHNIYKSFSLVTFSIFHFTMDYPIHKYFKIYLYFVNINLRS